MLSDYLLVYKECPPSLSPHYPTMKQLPTEPRTSIISILGNGDSCHKIAARLGVGHSIVYEQCSQSASTLPKSVGGHPGPTIAISWCNLSLQVRLTQLLTCNMGTEIKGKVCRTDPQYA